MKFQFWVTGRRWSWGSIEDLEDCLQEIVYAGQNLFSWIPKHQSSTSSDLFQPLIFPFPTQKITTFPSRSEHKKSLWGTQILLIISPCFVPLSLIILKCLKICVRLHWHVQVIQDRSFFWVFRSSIPKTKQIITAFLPVKVRVQGQ